MNEFSLVYITASNREEAEKLARAILSERLAACVNIYDGVRSLYLWEGTLESSREAAMVVKTRSSLVSELARKIREIHSYELPCILSIPANYVDEDYGKWISRETFRSCA